MRAQLYDVLSAHATAYPRMKGEDYSCLAYESEFGSRDIFEEDTLNNLVNELNAVKTDALEPMTVGIGGGYSRINLPPVKQYLSAEIIYKMMEMCQRNGENYGYLRKLALIQRSANLGILPKEAENVTDKRPPKHSALYTRLYGSSYRIIPSEIAPIVPALCLVSEAISKSGGASVGIDGTTASGKTQTAALIENLFQGCNVTVTEGRGVLSNGVTYDVSLFMHTDTETRYLRLRDKGDDAIRNYEENLKKLDEELIEKYSSLDFDLLINT